MPDKIEARQWFVSGRVQVYAVGNPEQLKKLAATLHRGPAMADVRGVEEREAPVQQLSSFRLE